MAYRRVKRGAIWGAWTHDYVRSAFEFVPLYV